MKFNSPALQSPGKITFREMILIHYTNLSNEIVSDGAEKEYEDAVDSMLVWLKWEFCVHHAKVEIEVFDKEWIPVKTTFKDAFIEVMQRGWGLRWGSSIETKSLKLRRILDKQMLLSELLSKHKINLGMSEETEMIPLQEGEIESLIQGESLTNGGLPDESGAPDQ
jgi:hypothetical protein